MAYIKRPARFVESHGGLPSANLAYQERWALSVYGTMENLPSPEPPINGGIEDHDHEAHNHLALSRESIWIEDWKEVICDEVAVIAGLARLRAQPILQRCQRTDPAAEFHDRTPHDGRQVYPHDKPPSQGKQPTEQDETHEGDVNEHDQVGEQAIPHRRGARIRVTKTMLVNRERQCGGKSATMQWAAHSPGCETLPCYAAGPAVCFSARSMDRTEDVWHDSNGAE
jgi:hypothetical protein